MKQDKSKHLQRVLITENMSEQGNTPVSSHQQLFYLEDDIAKLVFINFSIRDHINKSTKPRD